MPERFIGAVLKTVVVKATESSNLSPSAIKKKRSYPLGRTSFFMAAEEGFEALNVKSVILFRELASNVQWTLLALESEAR